MKIHPVIFIILVLFCLNCHHAGNNKNKKIVTDIAHDSLSYYPPTPQALDQKEFRRYYRKINELFDSTLLNRGFNGGILVAKNGTVIYERYQGLADLRKKDTAGGRAGLITSRTPLHIASTSKTFTAMAVLRMAEKGKLSLNDSISKFFPGFPYKGITIQMLLNHRSGLPNYLYFMPDSNWHERKYAVNRDVLDFLVNKKPERNYPPGSHFNYCNTNYVILALIIEKISGKTFPDYMQKEIFGPLKMENTYVFSLKDTLSATPSFTYRGNYWDPDFLDGTYGDKNIYTTPGDLLKWDQALYTGQFISGTLLDSAFSGYSFEKPSVHNYGLGWRLLLLPNGKKVIYHFGKWHGSNAAFARLTDEKATIIILGNKFTSSIYGAAQLCYDIFGDYGQGGLDEEELSDSLSSGKDTALPDLKKSTQTRR